MKKIRILLIAATILLTLAAGWTAYRYLPTFTSNKNQEISFFQDGETKLVSRTKNPSIEVYESGEWKTFFVKGVNLGMAEPGKWFTQPPSNAGTYSEWFQDIHDMHANTIRIYTLLDPYFYVALKQFNEKHPNDPLWLLQEIWPEENPENGDYLLADYQNEYEQEIKHVIDAVHGKANITERAGRAFGIYTADVSPYVLGYLVGRELEPEEIVQTNERNKGYSFVGDYVSGNNASPTENWLAWSCDYVLQYEQTSYQWQHPVAVVSWPTLDPIEHDSEWNELDDKSKEYNDKISINVNDRFEMGSKMKAGFFGAYHIYPNYPDFMNNESVYNTYTDVEGRLRYGGYLQEFIAHHDRYPALVAEFGLATGMGNAHSSPDGYNHGGNSEKQQGEGIVRMLKAIQREGYMGGVIFEWIDEWAKKTWITEPFMIPYERHVLWHNGIDPEQNYGLVAMESIKPDSPSYSVTDSGTIDKLDMSANETYLYMDLSFHSTPDLDKDHLLIGLDTYDRTRGEFLFPTVPAIKAPSGMEFLLNLSSKEDSKILVVPSYNIENYHFASARSENATFEEMKRHINKQRTTKSGETIPDQYEDSSLLRYGPFDDSYNHWYIEGNTIHIRIPWGRLNVTDPSSALVLDDPNSFTSYPVRDGFKTTKTEGLVATAILASQDGTVNDLIPGESSLQLPKTFLWPLWDEPLYQKRLKKSYGIIQKYFEQIE